MERNQLPSELLLQLKGFRIRYVDRVILSIIESQEEGADLDKILIEYYRTTGEVMKRAHLYTRMYKLVAKNKVVRAPGKQGTYLLVGNCKAGPDSRHVGFSANHVDLGLVRSWQEKNGSVMEEGSHEANMVVLRHTSEGEPTVWCDPEIADLVDALNNGTLSTVASCSGHGDKPGSILMSDGRVLVIGEDLGILDKVFNDSGNQTGGTD